MNQLHPRGRKQRKIHRSRRNLKNHYADSGVLPPFGPGCRRDSTATRPSPPRSIRRAQDGYNRMRKRKRSNTLDVLEKSCRMPSANEEAGNSVSPAPRWRL